MAHHAIFMSGSQFPIVIQATSSAYRPQRGTFGWRVLEVPYGFVATQFTDLSLFPVVESYTPPRPVRAAVQTKQEGSWAATVINRKRR